MSAFAFGYRFKSSRLEDGSSVLKISNPATKKRIRTIPFCSSRQTVCSTSSELAIGDLVFRVKPEDGQVYLIGPDSDVLIGPCLVHENRSRASELETKAARMVKKNQRDVEKFHRAMLRQMKRARRQTFANFLRSDSDSAPAAAPAPAAAAAAAPTIEAFRFGPAAASRPATSSESTPPARAAATSSRAAPLVQAAATSSRVAPLVQAAATSSRAAPPVQAPVSTSGSSLRMGRMSQTSVGGSSVSMSQTCSMGGGRMSQVCIGGGSVVQSMVGGAGLGYMSQSASGNGSGCISQVMRF